MNPWIIIVFVLAAIIFGIDYLVAIAAVIMSLVFRKKGKIKASIWVNVAALMYIAVVLAVNSLVG